MGDIGLEPCAWEGWSVNMNVAKQWSPLMLKKITGAFEKYRDYLVGEDVKVSFDKKNLKRLQDIEKLDYST